jgi:hypothetical protein
MKKFQTIKTKTAKIGKLVRKDNETIVQLKKSFLIKYQQELNRVDSEFFVRDDPKAVATVNV